MDHITLSNEFWVWDLLVVTVLALSFSQIEKPEDQDECVLVGTQTMHFSRELIIIRLRLPPDTKNHGTVTMYSSRELLLIRLLNHSFSKSQ